MRLLKICLSKGGEISYRYLGILLIVFLLSMVSVNCRGGSKAGEEPKQQQYRIGVCDWMILKRQKIGSFKLANELNADGVEIDMGGLGSRELFDNKLREPHFVELFKNEADTYNLEIPSIAMSAFYAQSLVGRENYRELLDDCIQTMKKMNVKIAFLPLGVQGDLNKNPDIRPELVKRLKVAGDMAEQANVVIGIETSLDAASEIELLEEIGSPAIKIYFNFQNPLEADRDIYEELRILGKERICQIHCTDTDEVTLPYNKRLDMRRIKSVLDEMEWSGWLIVERSRDKNEPGNVRKNFGTNIEFLKDIFQR